MGRKIVRNAIYLIISSIICKILGLLFRLPLLNIVGVEGIAGFQLVTSVYAFLLVLISGGVSITLSKMVSELRKSGNFEKIGYLLKKSIYFNLITGGVVGLICVILSKKIAILQGDPSLFIVYNVIPFLLIVGGILASLKGFLQGYEFIIPTATSQIIEQTFKFGCGILFAKSLIKYGESYAILGAFCGILFGEIICFIYLVLCVKKLRVQTKEKVNGFYKNLTPLLLGASITPLISMIDSLLIISRLEISGLEHSFALVIFGLATGVVGTVMNIPLIFSNSIVTVLLPSLSNCVNQQEQKIKKAFMSLIYIIFPTSIGITAISKTLYQIIFPSLNLQMIEYAVNLTKITSLSIIILAISQFFIMLMQAKGQLIRVMIIQIIAGFFKVIVLFYVCALESVNIYGLPVSNIIFSTIILTGCLICDSNKIHISFFEFFLPIVSSLVMYYVVSALNGVLKFSLFVNLIISINAGFLVYCFGCLPFILSLYKEIKNKSIKLI